MSCWNGNFAKYYEAVTLDGIPHDYTIFDLPIVRSDHTNRNRRICFSLFVDALSLVLLFATIGIFYFLPSRTFYFTLSDPALMYPLLPSKIPSLYMWIINWIIPSALLTFSELCIFGRRKWNIIYVGKAYIECMTLSVFSSALFWLLYPSPRPNFYAVCQPSADSMIPINGIFYTMQACQGTIDSEIINGFPSGHASTAFASWTFVSLYFIARLKPFEGTGHLWKVVLCIIVPISICTWVSVTRVTDFHHFVVQVLFGAIFGILGAILAYRLNHIEAFWNLQGHITIGIFWNAKYKNNTAATVPFSAVSV